MAESEGLDGGRCATTEGGEGCGEEEAGYGTAVEGEEDVAEEVD